jgi:hypothetical protein
MNGFRREFLKLAGTGLAGATVSAVVAPGARAEVTAPMPAAPVPAASMMCARLEQPATARRLTHLRSIRRSRLPPQPAGGTVLFPSGVYASYSIRLKSNIALYLEQGATILAASTSLEGTTSGYDPAEPRQPWEGYQDYGHNHWHNSLIWGEGINNFAILGPGLIWGKGLSRGTSDKDRPCAETLGAGNKAIALKNCHNVTLRDFSILEAGISASLLPVSTISRSII